MNIPLLIVWVCLSCGHHYQGKEPPETCPHCDASKTEYHLIEED